MPIVKTKGTHVTRCQKDGEPEHQGYPDIPTLKADIRKIKSLCEGKSKQELKEVADYEIRGTCIGVACDNIKEKVHDKLKKLFGVDDDNKPVENITNKVNMGDLKKVPRVYQKAVHYAMEENATEPQLGMVRDILRAQVVFPESDLEKNAASYIDKVDRAFEGAVIQVKNRFIQGKLAKVPLDTKVREQCTDDLKEYLLSQIADGLHGRDCFYRDIQLLLKLEVDKWPGILPFSHVYFELQLTSSKMADAKHDGGHKAYRTIRNVMEYYEFYIRKEGNKSPDFMKAFPNVERNNYDVDEEDWKSFGKCIDDMVTLYNTDLYKNPDTKKYASAIEDSLWYRNLVAKK